MEILLWLVIHIVSVIITIMFRLWIAVKKCENKKINMFCDVIAYSLIIIAIVVAIILAVLYKTILSYMYLCSTIILLIMNIVLSVVLYVFRHKEL